MNVEEFRNYCVGKKGVTEDFPFDENVLVFKVVNKLFALSNIEDYKSINLKCDPQKAEQLREQYSEIKPGYHMNKKHWNSVYINGTLPESLVKELIDHSYDLVVGKLTKKERLQLL